MSLYFHADGHPRTRFPELADVLPDEQIMLWQMYGLCLCGCGEKTRARHPESNPYEISYFTNGHYVRWRKAVGRPIPHRRSPSHDAAQRRENMSRSIDGTAILDMVREYIDKHHGGSITRFARAVGINHSSLVHAYRRSSRITKPRARQLLEAIGEPVPPFLQQLDLPKPTSGVRPRRTQHERQSA